MSALLLLLLVPLGAVLFLLLRARPSTLLVTIVAIRSVSDVQTLPADISFDINLCLALLALVTGLRFALFGKREGRSTAAWFVLAFIVVWLVVALVQFGIEQSVLNEGLRGISIACIVFIARAAIVQDGGTRVTALLIWWLAPVLAILAVGSTVNLPFMPDDASARSSGTFNQENGAAFFSAIYTTLALHALISSRLRRYLIPLLLGLAGAAATLSIGGTAALAAGLLLLVLLDRRLTIGIRIATIFIIAVAAIAFVTSSAFGVRIEELQDTNFDNPGASGDPNSFEWRIHNWQLLLIRFAQQPLIGWGYGTTNALITPLGKQPHSEYVRILVETGIVGTAIAVIAVIVIIVRFTRRTRQEPRAQYALGAATLGATLLNATAANTISYVPAMYLFIATWAIAQGALDRTDPAAPPGPGRQLRQFRPAEPRWRRA